MYNKDQINLKAAEYAKEIVVAWASNADTKPYSGTGQDVADFYIEIFKGISKVMLESISNYE